MSRSPIESREVIIHLQAQLASLLGLRDVMAEQDDAVEASDPQRVLDAVAELRVQLAGRVQIETEREQLLGKWSALLDCLPEEISAGRLAELDPANGSEIRKLSADIHTEALRVQSMHAQVQERLRSELNFVSCLVDALYPPTNAGGYSVSGPAQPKVPMALDVRG